MRLEAVLFDVIGTTVREKDPDTIMNCFEKAFQDSHVPFDHELVRANRGKDKMEMIAMVLKKNELAMDSAAQVYKAFSSNVAANLDNFMADNDAAEIFTYLRNQGIRVGLGTGLSRDLFEKIITQVNWNPTDFDYIGISAEIGRSRPYPDMILDMMAKLKISDARAILKVGDTVADIQEGKNAGVKTAAVLAGTQSPEELEKAGPDFILRRLGDITNVFSR